MEKIQEKKLQQDSHRYTQINTDKKSKRFIIGIILILGSIAYGWIGLIGCNAMAIKYGRFWFILGWIIYGVSWITYALGFLLAGASGIAYAKRLFLRKSKKREISGPLSL